MSKRKPKRHKPTIALDSKGRVAEIDIKLPIEVWNAFGALAAAEGYSPTEMVWRMISGAVLDERPVDYLTKGNAAILRREQKRMELEFNQRVQAEVLKHDELWLGQQLAMFDKADRIVKATKGVISSTEYKNLQWCLHTDTIGGVAKQGVLDDAMKARLDRALSLINGLEAVLVKEPSTVKRPTMAELMQRREQILEERRRKRAASRAPGNRAMTP